MTLNPNPPPFRPLVGTLVYVWDREQDMVLMVSRDARPDDDQFGKINGLGGKVEQDESIVAGARRELREEASIELVTVSLRGTITWSSFGPKLEQWLGFVFLCDSWTGTVPSHNVEGTLRWISRERLLRACGEDQEAAEAAELPMWAGDRHFVPLVFDEDPRPFHGTMPYDGDRPLEWSFERL